MTSGPDPAAELAAAVEALQGAAEHLQRAARRVATVYREPIALAIADVAHVQRRVGNVAKLSAVVQR